jgi:diadenosine tetraphosphatase ApaH/serine/threonine PP2A family protein phosphatase
MRCAIFADIHANLQALEAVLADARDFGCNEFHCLGDVVGYNANPAECVDIVRGLSGTCIQGNHDEGASGNKTLETFSSTAATSLEWTRKQLDHGQKEWLGALRLQRQIRKSTFVHASLDSPSSWGYVRSLHDAEMTLSLQRTPLCFIGHTHVPRAFGKGLGEVQLVDETGGGISLPNDKKLLINAGSVGQPRDGDWRASYLIHDEESEGLWLRRVEYDVDAAARAVLDAGLPEKLASRLRTGS